MSRLVRFLSIILFSGAFLTGCAYAVSPVTGVLYNEVDGPIAATSAPTSSQVGAASCYSLFGLIGIGDASIETAARNGSITKIHHVDFSSTSLLGIFAKFTIKVYGE